jgi:diguanylate cyclase (GGDEF)-like protein
VNYGLLTEFHDLSRRRQWVLVVLAALATAGLLVHLLRDGLHDASWGATVLPPDALHDALEMLAAVACLCRAWWVPRDRRPWMLFGAGILAYAVGDTLWFAWLGHLKTPPYPSYSDGFWLSFYVLAIAAVVLLVRDRLNFRQATLWLDGLMGGTVIAAIGSAILFRDGLGIGGLPWLVAAVNLAYPLMDLSLGAAVIAIFALTGWRPGRMWVLLGLGLATLAVADTAFIYVSSVSAVDIGILRPMYVLAMLLVALAAWHEPQEFGVVDLASVRMLVLPTFFIVVAGIVLAIASFGALSPVAVWLALGALAGVIVRTWLTFRDLGALATAREQAMTDELTGLGNRRLLYTYTDERLAEAAESTSFALLLVDLDRFKELNDTLGHLVGDNLLVQIGSRLRDALRPDDILVRLGGDEFAALLAHPSDAKTAAVVAQRMRRALEVPFLLDGIPVHVDASIGGAVYPENGDDVSSLLRHADIAMYRAKSTRTSFQLYTHDGTTDAREQLAIVGDLRRAIHEGELVVYYQPKASLTTGEITGVEALVRWQHPERGLLPPSEFIPAAEQTGVMRDLTAYVLDQALAQCARWNRLGRTLSVAVNLSTVNVLDRDLPNQLERLLERHEVPGRLLRLEVTENVIMADPEHAEAVLRALRRLGVFLSLDDFGTGYSSLANLTRLAVDELKIDRSFVSGMSSDPHHAAIVRSTISLAHALGLQVVAEGVEHREEWEQLAQDGCDEAQGYLLSPPVPAAQLDVLLDQHAARAA